MQIDPAQGLEPSAAWQDSGEKQQAEPHEGSDGADAADTSAAQTWQTCWGSGSRQGSCSEATADGGSQEGTPVQDAICRRQTVQATAQATAQAAPSARGGRQGRKGLVGNGQGEREVRGATWAVGGGTWQVIARVKHHRAERRCGLKGAGGRQRGACGVLSGGRAERCGYGGHGTGSRLSVLCGGGSHAVRVGSCFGVRPFVAGRAATWLGAVQPECAAFEATARAVVRGVEFRVTVRRSYLILSYPPA